MVCTKIKITGQVKKRFVQISQYISPLSAVCSYACSNGAVYFKKSCGIIQTSKACEREYNRSGSQIRFCSSSRPAARIQLPPGIRRESLRASNLVIGAEDWIKSLMCI